MATQLLTTLKSWFETGKRPTQQHFHDLLDSFFHKNDGISISNVAGLTAALASKADATPPVTLLSKLECAVTTLADVTDFDNADFIEISVTNNNQSLRVNDWLTGIENQKVGAILTINMHTSVGGVSYLQTIQSRSVEHVIDTAGQIFTFMLIGAGTAKLMNNSFYFNP